VKPVTGLPRIYDIDFVGAEILSFRWW